MHRSDRTSGMLTVMITQAMTGKKVGMLSMSKAKATKGYMQAKSLITELCLPAALTMAFKERALTIEFSGGGSLKFYYRPTDFRGLEFHTIGFEEAEALSQEDFAQVKSRERLK